MNPYVIIGALVAALALGGAVYWYGTTVGKTKQEVADQAQFDRVNRELATQKAEAATKLAQVTAAQTALLVERDQLKTRLEGERETHRKTTDDLRAQYAALKLRVALPGAEAGGSRGGGGGTGTTSAGPSGPAGTAFVQLPDSIANDLRQLAFDADQLRDDYAQCYGYAQQVR